MFTISVLAIYKVVVVVADPIFFALRKSVIPKFSFQPAKQYIYITYKSPKHDEGLAVKLSKIP